MDRDRIGFSAGDAIGTGTYRETVEHPLLDKQTGKEQIRETKASWSR